jgi:hypothetical protein
VLRTVIGSGTTTTKVAHLPHARYTFFTDEDPANCILGVQLQNAAGRYVAGDQLDRQPRPDVAPETFNFALVQTDVPEGDYRVRVSTGTQPCGWRLEEILNSMSSDQAPPQAEKAPPPPAFDATISSANAAQTIDIPTSGLYAVGLSLTRGPGVSYCPVTHGFLINAAGESEAVLGGQGPTPPPRPTPVPSPKVGLEQGQPMFLAAGVRTARVDTACSWQLSVKPWLGPTGGGAQGFATPKPSPSVQ